ncbi:stabilizer of axonemal microtubules 1-like [Aphidius gifuensis]|uniref:stabilizer of axonemal microtubules 1-like n=1 Tax=Aphidius gifuensis TaxID=684658 RepID=UPI001CDB9F8C|nr:stabilizer of axonemal microtubules 1-like [Aphidius gifuensis]
MEICPPVTIRENDCPRSIITIKNKIRLGHDECCNCCCCTTPQSKCLKYIQPDVPKSFKPVRYYSKGDVPMEKKTTYKLSFWEGDSFPVVKPALPEDSLTVGDGPMTDDTTHRLSYLGNWCIKPEEPCTPCTKNLLGRGPMEDNTTNKLSYTWKSQPKVKPFKLRGNLYCPCACMSDDTTYKLSYYESGCRMPVNSFKPSRVYEKSDVPMEGCTTYKLSYWPTEIPLKQDLPWSRKNSYKPPDSPIDDNTTYKLSYWPNKQPVRKPFNLRDNGNLLNRGCCFDDNTTYNLSYYGCGSEKRQPIIPTPSMHPPTCPLSHDTIHKMSYLGNWCPKTEEPFTPCTKNLLGRGPMEDETTNKLTYTWKTSDESAPFHPEDNLEFSIQPLESCTTHKLSYFPNDPSCIIKNQSFKPMRVYKPADAPMEDETTMKLSYQPVEKVIQPSKPWSNSQKYYPPLTPIDDETTYNLSFIPPGTLQEVCSSTEQTSSKTCDATCHSTESLSSVARPCNSCCDSS